MKNRQGRIVLWVLTLAILGGCLWALYATGFFQVIGSPEQMGEYIARSAPWSHLTYFGVQILSVVIAPIPSNITAPQARICSGCGPLFCSPGARWRQAPPWYLPWHGCWVGSSRRNS